MIDNIVIVIIISYSIGGVFMALGLIKLAVVLQHCWLQAHPKKFFILKIPSWNFHLLVCAMFFLLLSFVWVLAGSEIMPYYEAWPLLLVMIFLLLASISAYSSMRDFNQFLSKKVKKQ